MENKDRLAREVGAIYNRLDRQIQENNSIEICQACGKCCDFESFDHKLYVTSAEMVYLTAMLGSDNIKPMADGVCPYNVEGKCSIHGNRFAGCRIFNCKGDKDLQGRLSEEAIKKFKEFCIRYEVPYRYTDIASALNTPDIQ